MRRTSRIVITTSIAALALAACSTSSNQSTDRDTDAPTSSTPTAKAPSATTPATPATAITIGPHEAAGINPKTPITVQASRGDLSSVVVTNATGYHVKGGYVDGKSKWATNEPLGYGKSYHVVAKATGDGGPVEKTDDITVLKPQEKLYPSVLPAPTVIHDVGVGQPIGVIFDKAPKDKVAAQQALTVETSPQQAGAWYWISDREVHYRPQVFWKPGTKITLHADVYGAKLGPGQYGEEDRTVGFTVHDSWVAVANGTTETMGIYHNDQLVNTMPISMGKQETPTHAGIHVISDKDEEYTMDSCTYGVCSGPEHYVSTEYYAMRISNDGEFVHLNPLSEYAQGSSNVSHGCINLNEENAQWFYDHFNLGDVVKVENSGGPELPVWDLYGDWSLPWSQWSAGNAA